MVPYYNNPTMPMYQPPMQDRLAQLQNQYQAAIPMPQNQPMQMQYVAQQPQMMIGRYVNDFSEVTANDVPMDGRSAVFVKSDMSEIQTRAWSADGKIVPVSFKPVQVAHEPAKNTDEKIKVGLSEEDTQALMKRFDDISDRLDKMEKSISARTTASKPKKEVDAE